MKKTVLTALLAGAAALANAAIPLWPEGVPGAKQIGAERIEDGRIRNVSEPTLTVYPAAVDRPTKTAVIICPGGGYEFVSGAREGEQYAYWLSTLGITSFVLKYRMAEFGHPAPLQDVLRAVRLVRSQATQFGVDPNRIGIIGSSAGGHLAASAGTLFDHPQGRTGNALDAVSARPDFLMLLYPVILMDGPAIHAGSRKNLLGANPAPDLVRLMSVEKQVTAQTPPTILFHSQDDGSVPVENSIAFYQALTRAKVPAEMYLYERGGHGMGMRTGQGNATSWPRRAEEWLREHKLIAQ
ncbi:MAG: alpha/beta hydrolase [Gammaproteobacteria bacterium]